jgi:hypothetical protein
MTSSRPVPPQHQTMEACPMRSLGIMHSVLLAAGLAFIASGADAGLYGSNAVSPGQTLDVPKAERFDLVQNAANDRIRVTGRLMQGAECPALRADDGQLYTLATRNLGPFKIGDRVQVVGRRLEISFCQEGITIEVIDIQRAP